MRIVSLAPTQTEILAALGCAQNLIGITENCDYPEAIQNLPTFGSWWAPDLPRVVKEKPDLVCTFGQHQEEMAATLQDAGLHVYHSDPGTVEASLATFVDLAVILDCEKTCHDLLGSLRTRLERVEQAVALRPLQDRPRVFRIMNWNPLISVGPGSFQHDVIQLAGGRNVMADSVQPYLVCVPELVAQRDPEAIFFCEPQLVEFLKEQAPWSQVNAVQAGRVFVFDCGLTCRSGPRIVDMVEGLAAALHPDLFTSKPSG